MKLQFLWKLFVPIFFIIVSLAVSLADTPGGKIENPQSILKVFGPGGPYQAIRECADIFSAKTGIAIDVKVGTPPEWIAESRKDGDLIFQGAEFMLIEFMRRYPDIVDGKTITGLFARCAGILVRKTNPKGIQKLEDLSKKGVKIMVVTQENMQEIYERVPGIHYNIVAPVLTGSSAVKAWRNNPELDAWIT